MTTAPVEAVAVTTEALAGAAPPPGAPVPAAAPGGAQAKLARRAFGALLASHAIIDIFPMYITSLMLVWQGRLALTELQTSLIYMASPIFSGICQPFFAWLSDRYDSRLTGPAGLVLGALCLGSIGFAQNFEQFLVLQILGVLGTGMYHPVCAALAGQTGSRVLRPGRPGGRALAIGVFIAAGMAGNAVGPIVATGLNLRFGSPVHIVWTIPPALVLAIVLLVATRRIPHRHENHATLHARIPRDQLRRRRLAVANLTAQNALRFTSNVGMVIMFNTWAAMRIREAAIAAGAPLTEKQVQDLGATVSANLTAAMTLGMAVGVLATGRYIAPGRERAPLLYLSLIGALFMAFIGYTGDWFAAADPRSHLAMLPSYICTALAPIGFFSTFPIATSLAQRLLPRDTGLVTSLMMGVGWTISALSTPFAILCFGNVMLNEAQHLSAARINIGYLGYAALLVLAGLLALMLPKDLLKAAADDN